MKQKTRILALLLALIMVLALPAMAAEYPKETGELAADYTGKTVILSTNDVHGAIENYAKVAQLKKDLQAKGAEVILVDAGDFSQGSPYVSISKGANAVELMNGAGYDLVTLGNHEFDYGVDQLKANEEKAAFKIICADVLKDGELIFEPSYVYESASGLKIGFFGLETPETQTKVNPGLIQGLTFLSNSGESADLDACANEQAKALKAAGADLVIGLWHLGVDDESAPDGHRSIDVLAQTEGIDLVLDGHSHTEMTAGEAEEAVLSTGTKLANVGVVVIDNETKAIESRFLLPTEGLAEDETVAAAAAEIKDAVDTAYGEVFATSEVELNGAKAPNGNRDSETNNGDLITEAMRWTVLKEGALEVPEANVVAITNGGGIRAKIAVGDVTMKDINTVLPFGNTVAVIYISGSELLEVLEASTFCTPTAIGGFPQTTGIEWTLNTTKTYDANAETYPDSTYYGPATIQRVEITAINGEPFDETATYAVVTNDFCSAGGDTYYAFKTASAQFDTGIPMDEAVIDYVKTELGGVIGEKYAAPHGDLTIITIENTKIQPTTQALEVDGEAREAEAYNINGENYFKLRDVAMLLTGTDAQFEVIYDEETNTIVCETGKAYTPVGGELEEHADRSASICVSPQKMTVDGEEVNVTAYNLEGNNFFRLRDLARVLGFDVDYVKETRTVTVNTASLAA